MLDYRRVSEGYSGAILRIPNHQPLNHQVLQAFFSETKGTEYLYPAPNSTGIQEQKFQKSDMKAMPCHIGCM